MEARREILGGGKSNVESPILLEARPCAGESDMEIVAGAWALDCINRRHARHLKALKERPSAAPQTDPSAKELRRWMATEREAWLEAVRNDPLLPVWIVPSQYPGQGQEAWRRRNGAGGCFTNRRWGVRKVTRDRSTRTCGRMRRGRTTRRIGRATGATHRRWSRHWGAGGALRGIVERFGSGDCLKHLDRDRLPCEGGWR
jgi:hypothetical protein